MPRPRNPNRPKRPAEANGRTVLIPVDILDALTPAADARGISVNALVRRLLDTIGDDGLTDSILDDAFDLGAVA